MSTTILIAIPLGLAIGAILGSLGAGGSVLAVPALVYILGMPVTAATTASLAVVSANAAVGATVNARRGSVDPRLAVAFAGAGIVGAVGGSALSRLVTGEALLFLLALLMLVSAWLLWKRPAPRAIEGMLSSPDARRWAKVAVTGLGVGVLTGFFGVGGGFVIVPALIVLLGLPVRLAVGTSLMVIAVVSAGGLLGHLGASGISWGVTIAFGLAGTAGALLGALGARRVPTQALGRAFSIGLVALAITLMVANAGAVGIG